jgi:presenilin-like A22 family membrane protease
MSETPRSADGAPRARGLELNFFVQTSAAFVAAFGLAYLITAPAAGVVPALTAVVSPPSFQHPGWFLLTFAIASVVAFLLIKYVPGERFWQLFFGAAALAGVFVSVYYLLVRLWPTVPVAVWLAGAAAGALIVGRWFRPVVWLHNLVVLLAAVGVARLLGFQFSPRSATMIVVVLAIYDIIAVFFSRHMVTMARVLFERQAFFGLVMPNRLAGWKQKLADATPGRTAAVLGAGDLAFPLLYAFSHLFYSGTRDFLVITGFTFVGVVVLHGLSLIPKQRRPLPALPPLIACQLLGALLLRWLA